MPKLLKIGTLTTPIETYGGAIMQIFRRNGLVWRMAMRSADERRIPDSMLTRHLLILFMANAAALFVTRMILYPLIFVTSYVFAKRRPASGDTGT